jgi:hypothetical protein
MLRVIQHHLGIAQYGVERGSHFMADEAPGLLDRERILLSHYLILNLLKLITKILPKTHTHLQSKKWKNMIECIVLRGYCEARELK